VQVAAFGDTEPCVRFWLRCDLEGIEAEGSETEEAAEEERQTKGERAEGADSVLRAAVRKGVMARGLKAVYTRAKEARLLLEALQELHAALHPSVAHLHVSELGDKEATTTAATPPLQPVLPPAVAGEASQRESRAESAASAAVVDALHGALPVMPPVSTSSQPPSGGLLLHATTTAPSSTPPNLIFVCLPAKNNKNLTHREAIEINNAIPSNIRVHTVPSLPLHSVPSAH
jgi:hypothetical protein